MPSKLTEPKRILFQKLLNQVIPCFVQKPFQSINQSYFRSQK